MPPPILKKTRGPSSTGPRPTARFISPHSSEEEEEEEGAAETPPTKDLGAHVVVRPPTPESPISKEEKKAETLTGPRKKAHSFVATTAAQKRRPGVTRRPNSDLSTRANESGLGSSGKDVCWSLPEKPNQPNDIEVLQTQLNSREQTLLPPENRISTKTSKKTRLGKSGHSKASLKEGSASKNDVELESTTNSRLHGLPDEAESSNSVRPSGKRQSYAFQADNINKREVELQGYQVERNTKSVRPERLEKQTTASGQNAAARVTMCHPPKNMDTKSSISVAPTYTVAIGKTGLENNHSFETADDEIASISGNDQERSLGRAEQASLFAKRPVQPVKSASALFGNPKHQSNDTLSRSKSQLTLLLEKDRAKDRENKEGHDSASKANDARPS
jgi:hypothetical protein